MASNGFSIADPADPGMLDVVGFDASAPQVMASFAAARNDLQPQCLPPFAALGLSPPLASGSNHLAPSLQV